LEVDVTRVRLSVDVDPELRRRVRMAAASKDQSVKEWLEDVLRRELKRTDEDIAWMESDLSLR
jgi:predicted transcriptional regulator